jgi:hypothetical protein
VIETLMKFLLLLLALVTPLMATPDGYLYHLDKFFGQTDSHYAVIRYTYENKGSYYVSSEKSELVEFTKIGSQKVKTTILYQGTVIVDVDDSNQIERTMEVNPKANLVEKMSIYKTHHVTELKDIEGELTIWNDILRLDDDTVLMHGEELMDTIHYAMEPDASEPLKMDGLSLFSVGSDYYLRSKAYFEDDERHSRGRVLYLGEQVSKMLRDRDVKQDVYLTCGSFPTQEKARAFIKSKTAMLQYPISKFEIWKTSENQYVVVYADSTRLIESQKIAESEKMWGVKWTPMFSTSLEFRCGIKE